MSNNQKKGEFSDIGRLKKYRNRAGTTFVEALIAMSIFAVFTTGTCRLLVAQRKVLDTARDEYTAANIAKNRMELIRSFDFEQISQLEETDIIVDKNGLPFANGSFCRVTDITAVQSNLYSLAITVKVKNRKTLQFEGAGQSLSTQIAKHL